MINVIVEQEAETKKETKPKKAKVTQNNKEEKSTDDIVTYADEPEETIDNKEESKENDNIF